MNLLGISRIKSHYKIVLIGKARKDNFQSKKGGDCLYFLVTNFQSKKDNFQIRFIFQNLELSLFLSYYFEFELDQNSTLLEIPSALNY